MREDTKVNEARFLALVLLIVIAYSWATIHGQWIKKLGIEIYLDLRRHTICSVDTTTIAPRLRSQSDRRLLSDRL